MKAIVAIACLALASSVLAADPLAKDAVPGPLKTWIPWVMHGHETVACPHSHADGEERWCAWPSELTLDLDKAGGRFGFRVEIFAPGTWVSLPGDAEHWPQEVRDGNAALPVIEHDGVPQVRLPVGSHNLTGSFSWREPPQSLKLPAAVGIVRARFAGRSVNAQPDDEGLLWLQQESAQDTPDTLALQVFRLVDDGAPMLVTTQFDLVAAGRPREVVLPLALLEGFVPMSLDSPLPARLGEDGQLRVQLRPGNWRVTVGGRRMAATTELVLPKGAGWDEELWAFRAHHDLRLVALDGGQSVDPKQTAMPEAWKGLPAVRLTPGESLRLKVARRGEGGSTPDRLTLHRQAWLDFDGAGYTMQDHISGEILRSWRLEIEPGVELGRVAVDGEDQPITRVSEKAGYGVEMRQGRVDIVADSRRTGGIGELPGSSWNADLSNMQTTLNLPPGWRLLHASGVDRASGTWIAQWDLWAFFFVLLSALAAAKLFGPLPGVGCALALALSWHLEGTPGLLWPGVLGLVALDRVLPAGRLQRVAAWIRRGLLAVILLMLAALAVTLVRQSLYPSLEHPAGATRYSAVPAAAPAPAPVQMQEAPMLDKSEMARDLVSEPARAKLASKQGQRQFNIDPSARVQTGPGLPSWHWRQYSLSWSGPVERGQNIGLWLLPPMATAVMNLLTALSLAYLFWVVVGRPGGWPKGGRGGSAVAAALVIVSMIVVGVPEQAWAVVPVAADPPADAGQPPATANHGSEPSDEVLKALRDKLTQAPDCLPQCADLARLHVMADATSLRLRLQLHAVAAVMVPLPGQKAQFAPDRVLADGKPAALRRDDQGLLWVGLHAGVNDVTMEAAAPADTVQLALPMAPRQLAASLAGWSLGGLDARGEAAGALTLVRALKTQGAAHAGVGQTMPPFVRVTRNLVLADRWTLTTSIVREGPSPLPLEVRVPLLAGEAVTNAEVRVDKGVAIVMIGQAEGASFQSNVAEAASLKFAAGSAPNQVETWRVDADPRWHFESQGLDPVRQRDEGGRLAPVWQPWPGESMQLAISRPKGVEGQTLTVDAMSLSLRPGERATDVTAQLSLRSSQGRNHVVELPEGVQLQTVAIDGKPLSIRAQGRALTLPIEPGAHRIALEWREPRGMTGFFESSDFGLNAAGANASVELVVPGNRVALALKGPVLGPAVLFWGVLVVLVAGAWVLARLRVAPLSFAAWVLLGVGLAQSSVVSVAIVVAWFAAFAARERFAGRLAGGRLKLVQVGLALWTLLAVGALLRAIHGGLLGYPDLLVEGNGSTSSYLSWFADRVGDKAPQAWVVSVPLWAFRIAMLLWALWLARALLGWVKWAWSAFSAGGYWPPAGAADKRGWFARRRGEAEQAAPAPAEVPATNDQGL